MKKETIQVRLTTEEKARIVKMAKVMSMTITQYVKFVVLKGWW